MKIGRIIRLVLIIGVIIAIVATLAVMDVLGFVISLGIIVYSLMCIIGAVYKIYSAYENIKSKEYLSAVGDILVVVILLLVGTKILKWLMSILM